ncbi:hypothetical protein MJO28_008476 [Puccinia striiformis f. sp. tritici]|uniref:Uncharacterized protein n=1 Tax=Puccinia striiformis f. sp. tritici TaxID=168172 RepID=A0ACC0ECL6_9BASI|nr:hypothetical protein MJO28_008476 [Puccinia striiformis f. sp. tritici]
MTFTAPSLVVHRLQRRSPIINEDVLVYQISQISTSSPRAVSKNKNILAPSGVKADKLDKESTDRKRLTQKRRHCLSSSKTLDPSELDLVLGSWRFELPKIAVMF